MSRISGPVLFSAYFNIPPEDLEKSGLVDPFLNVDIPLFIDPVLVEKSSNDIIRNSAFARFKKHFEELVRLLIMSENVNDVAWKAARGRLDLSEPPENGLGFGGSGRSGSSRPDNIREIILKTSKEIIRLGSKDPEMISLMGFFEEDVGPDTISDLTTNVILPDLIKVTENFCLEHKIPVQKNDKYQSGMLPVFRRNNGQSTPIVLVPRDIVRELPIANDWSDIERVALENAKIRQRVNSFLGGVIRPTVAQRKYALRSAALSSSHEFEYFLAAVKENVSSYDPTLDALGYYKLKEILSKGIPGSPVIRAYNLEDDREAIMQIVIDTINLFKRHVEQGNLWEELWINGKPKKERAAQLIYYAIADAFCKMNNIDISPEANMGGGPIDFKFSKGYYAKVLVEMKKSTGAVVHGYEKQMEFYKAASQTELAVFVIINYGSMGSKLNAISRIRQSRINAGQRASEIIVIDARAKPSASKRK